MKITLFYYVVDCGDGSATPYFFTTKEKRDAFQAAEENRESFQGFCEADGQVTVIVNPDGSLSDPHPGIYGILDREPEEFNDDWAENEGHLGG